MLREPDNGYDTLRWESQEASSPFAELRRNLPTPGRISGPAKIKLEFRPLTTAESYSLWMHSTQRQIKMHETVKRTRSCGSIVEFICNMFRSPIPITRLLWLDSPFNCLSGSHNSTHTKTLITCNRLERRCQYAISESATATVSLFQDDNHITSIGRVINSSLRTWEAWFTYL